MDKQCKTIIWSQFGAAIDMLENAIKVCPVELWRDRTRQPMVWYLVFHTLFYLDCYLSDSLKVFTPPPPFTLDELDPAGLLPDRAYSKAELQNYLYYGRRKCRKTIDELTQEKAYKPCSFDWLDLTNAELLLYNMRHVQHHAAQLNFILRAEINTAPRWVKIVRSKPRSR
jgi:hypothetical protein